MYHKTFIVGFLSGDPSMRYMQNGDPVTNFSVPVNEKWTGQDGEKKERTIWYRVTVWRRQAETCNQFLSKGSQVFIEGRMQSDPETGGPRIYTKSDGTQGASFEITATTVRFLGGGKRQESSESGEGEGDADGIPF